MFYMHKLLNIHPIFKKHPVYSYIHTYIHNVHIRTDYSLFPYRIISGMDFYFKREDKKKQIIENHGEQKYNDMITSLNDKDKIFLTHHTVIPEFLKNAAKELRGIEP